MKLICANFKMNLLKNDILNYLKMIENKIDKNVVFFPSSLYLDYFTNYNHQTGSQDISFQEWGAITGDLSIHQLKELGITYTLVGHSERREFYNDNKNIKKKIKLALENNLGTILCLGENEDEKNANQTFEILKKEIDEALKNNEDLLTNDNLIIAYEPIWAIGTGKIPTNEDISTTALFIKNYVKKFYKINVKVLYGGSVNLTNICTLEKIEEIDGYLIGGACLDANNFLELISKIN